MSLSLTDRMRSDIRGSAWPLTFSAKAAPLAAFLLQLDRSQWLDPDAIAEGQFVQLGSLAKHLYAHNASFRQRLGDAGLDPEALGSIEGLRALPPLKRQQVQDRAIFSQQVPQGHTPVSQTTTSGSTGEPVIIARTAINQLHWAAVTLRYHLWSEPDFMGRICAVRADIKQGQTPTWGAPVSTLFDSGPGLKIDITTDIKEQLRLIADFAPASLIMYPSNFIALLDEMDAQGVDLPDLKRVRPVGETVDDSLRIRVAERLNATLFDCYSSQEFGYLALQCPDSDLYHVMSETLLLEVVDEDGLPCREGQTGRILVTDLHNHATPLIRYDIRDFAELGPPCPCGRGLPTLRRLRGRERNMMVLPDGTRHWGLTGFRQFRDIAPIVQYQMRQPAPDRLELRMVVARPLQAAEEGALRTHLQTYLGHPFEIELTYFEGRLPVGRNGKFEEFMRTF